MCDGVRRHPRRSRAFHGGEETRDYHAHSTGSAPFDTVHWVTLTKATPAGTKRPLGESSYLMMNTALTFFPSCAASQTSLHCGSFKTRTLGLVDAYVELLVADNTCSRRVDIRNKFLESERRLVR